MRIRLSKKDRQARLILALNGIKLVPNDYQYGYRYRVQLPFDTGGAEYEVISYSACLDALRKHYPALNL